MNSDPLGFRCTTIKLGRDEFTVDHPMACPEANHATGWHLYWITDQNDQRVRIVRLCPKEAESRRHRQQPKRKRDDDYDR